MPNVPLTLSTPFTRDRTNGKPLAKHHLDYVGDRSAKRGACGVDGLEPGHRYALRVAGKRRLPWDVIRWWEYGTKEQVLSLDGDGAGLDGRRVRFGPGPHEAIMVDSTSIEVVEFQCRE